MEGLVAALVENRSGGHLERHLIGKELLEELARQDRSIKALKGVAEGLFTEGLKMVDKERARVRELEARVEELERQVKQRKIQ